MCKVFKFIFVIRLVFVEIFRFVEMFLKNNLVFFIGVLIVKDVERFLVIGFDEVYVILFEIFFKKVYIVFG